MKILALQGKSILDNSNILLAFSSWLTEVYHAEVIYSSDQSTSREGVIILEIDKLTIGLIIPLNDEGSSERSLETLFNFGCNIMICSSPSAGMPLNWIAAYLSSKFEIEYFGTNGSIDEATSRLKDRIDGYITFERSINRILNDLTNG